MVWVKVLTSLGMTERVSGRNDSPITIRDVILFATLFAFEDYACLVTEDAIFPYGLRASDIGVLLAVIWSIDVFVRLRGRHKGYVFLIFPFVLAIVSTVISAAQATSLLSQPFRLGILPFRRMYASMLMSVAIVCALRFGLLSKRRLVRILYIIGLFELVLFTAQAILAGSVTFLVISTSEVRFGITRLRAPFLLPMLIGMMSFHNFLDSPHKEDLRVLGHLLVAVWSILFVGLICQHRAPTIILLVSYFVAILLSRGSASTKILGTMIALLVLAGIAATPMIQSTVESLSGSTSSASQNTLEIRADGHEYYLEKLTESPIVGFGWPNSTYLPATIAAGEGYNYYAADNGIYGLAYMLGAFGCAWIAIIYVGALRHAWKIRQSKGGALFQYFLFETGNLYMGLHWFYYYPMPFMIALALLDYDYGEASDGKR